MSPDDKSNREVETEIFNRFSRIVKEKFTSLADDVQGDGGTRMNQMDALYKLPEFDAEKRILTSMNNMGLTKGAMTGLACFAFLRFSPGAISRWLMKRRGGTVMGGGGMGNNPFHQTSGYKLDPNPNQQPPVQQPGLAFRLVRLCVDTFVSLSIGAYASMYFVDKEEMMRSFSDIPLVEGRSLLSEELCSEFSREFRQFDRRTWDKNHPALTGSSGHAIDDGGHDFRNTMQGFTANCRRRAIYEEELRKERGMRSNEPVAIPSPGVPRSIAVTLDDLYEEEGMEGASSEAEENGDDFFDTYFDMTDEEDQDSFSK